MLIVRPKSEHADENWLSSVCRSWAEWATSAVSSAKRRSRTVKIFTFRFALRRAWLKRLPSVLVWSLIPRDEHPKPRYNSIENKIPKRVGASTQPCFTPFVISNELETLPSHWIVVLVFMWKDYTMLKRLGGHPIFSNIANSPSLLTRSKALVRSIKPIYKGMFCSLHFTSSCRIEKIISVVERLALNPHWDSRYTVSASFCKRGRTTRAKALPTIPRR